MAALPNHGGLEDLFRSTGAPTCCMATFSSVRRMLQHALHARLAESAEAPQIGPADGDALGAHAQRLDDVGAAAEAGIDQHRHVARRLDDLLQRFDGRAAGLRRRARRGWRR